MTTPLTLLILLATHLSLSAQERLVPFISADARGVLGGVRGERFVGADDAAPAVTRGASYLLYGLATRGTKVTVRGVRQPDDVCPDYRPVTLSRANATGVAVASSVRWNPTPRRASAIALGNRTYARIVGDVLRSKGIATPTVRLRQAVRVDLDGDGVQEVLITATYRRGGIAARPSPGDHSFVLLRTVVDGTVRDVVVAGEFHPTVAADAAPPNEVRLSSILDLDGDGVMELVIYSRYYEGDSTWAVRIDGATPTRVTGLGTGCGV